MPTPVFNDTFAKFELEYEYFGLSRSQRDYVLMTSADLQKCNAGRITICPADRALYDTRSMTCESRLFPDARQRRTLQEEPDGPLHETYLVASRRSMGLPLPEPTPGAHQVSSGPRVGDAHPDTFRRWVDPERDRVHHNYR